MPRNFIWRAILITILSVALARPARADPIETAGALVVVGIVVLIAASAVLVVVLSVHHKNNAKAITGCVTAGANGMSLTDEKDKRTYALSGDPADVKAGGRMTLQGTRRKDRGNFIFDTQRVTKDFGACRK